MVLEFLSNRGGSLVRLRTPASGLLAEKLEIRGSNPRHPTSSFVHKISVFEQIFCYTHNKKFFISQFSLKFVV